MRRLATGTALAMLLVMPRTSAADPSEEAAKQGKKISEAIAVYHELITTPDKEVPKQLLERCKCVAVLPGVLKAALGYGARHGSGVMACRTANGWSAPAFVNLSGGSVGFQLGAESTDLVLFFMTDRGARSLVNGSRITLGGKASVAAGPFGRSGEADTNLELKSEIYSYARSKGLFAGFSIEGARLAPNPTDIENYYGKGVTYKQLLFGSGPPAKPAEAAAFATTLP
ncbi:MAG TPA: lipid-binding SYLF domain-containing protein [Candidatus Eisenbacteria bacterium]|jgi:lipid-binding SYLF domain-containing protein